MIIDHLTWKNGMSHVVANSLTFLSAVAINVIIESAVVQRLHGITFFVREYAALFLANALSTGAIAVMMALQRNTAQ
jgi:hypothetical protein